MIMGVSNLDLLKVNNRNTKTRCRICSKLTIKTPKRRQWPIKTPKPMANKDTKTTPMANDANFFLVGKFVVNKLCIGLG